MRLAKVTVRGFRGYKDAQTLELGDMTTLIGRNDVGKSTVLEALEIFFNNDVVKLDASDCNVGSEDSLIEISCTFTDFPDPLVLDAQAETSLADEYLLTADGALCIKKVWNCAGARLREDVYVTAQHPNATLYGDLFGLTNDKLKTRLRELNIDNTDVNQASNPSLRAAIWASR